MPEKRSATKRSAPRKAPAAKKAAGSTKPAVRKRTAPAGSMATLKKTASTSEVIGRDTVAATAPAAPIEVCPRCGTTKFGPEQRIRAEGSRTVRYTILLCERGHTFARPRMR